MKRVVVLGGGISGYGSAVLAKKKGFDVFLSDAGTIAERYRRVLEESGVGCFIPMQYHFRLRHGRRVKELVPVVRNLLFVHARPSDLRRVKDELPYLQYITDTRSHEKIIVPDAQMRHFIAAAGTYSDQLLYFRPEEVNLSKGTRVRVTGGDFAGREGVFVKVKGARDRRVVIAIEGVIAVALATIHPDLIEPIPV